MPSIGDFVDKNQVEGVQLLEEPAQPEVEVIERGGIDLSFLRAQTGEGSISEYMAHPLNFNGSKGVAQVLRGLTGMFGALNYAVVDIVLGVFQIMRKKPQAIEVNTIDSTGAAH